MTALIKDALREIRGSFGRFLSMLLIIALGCGFFTGLKATKPDMILTASDYFEENSLMDLRLRSNIGVKSQDIAAVRAADGVKGAYAGYSKDLYYSYNNQNVVLKAFSLCENVSEDSENYLNKPELVEGRLPEKKNECVVEKKMSSPDTFKIGEKITLQSPSADEPLSDTLAYDTYEIVGIVISPLYIGFERDSTNVGGGSVNSNIFLPESAFVCDYYTDLYVALDGLDGLDPFSDEYKSEVEKRGEAACEAFENSVGERYEKLKSDTQKTLDTAESKAKISEQVLACNADELAALSLQTENAVGKLQNQYDTMSESAKRYLVQAKLVQAKEKLEMINRLISDESGEVRAEYETALSQSRTQLDQGRAELEAMAELKIYSETRFEQNDYCSYKDDADKIDNVSKAFPMFFVLIAALVCITAMTRMVEEQRTVIGTYKALGYSSGAILAKYLIYAAAAAVVGSCAGSCLGLQIFPRLIINTYKIMYNIPGAKTPFRLKYMLLAMLVSLVLTSAAVVYTCAKELREQPAEIMRPKPPKSGKRVWLERLPYVWNRLGFLMKVTVRNLMRYKKRFVMTLVGVSGCTALIVTGFGLKYSVSSIVEKQFGGVFEYSAAAVLNTDTENPEKALDGISEITAYLPAVSQKFDAGTQNAKYQTTLIAPDGELDGFVNMESIDGGSLDLSDGAVVTEKLAKLCSLKAGDDITLTDSTGESVNVKIAGVMKNYALNYIFMSLDDYQKIFEEEGVCSVVYFNTKSGIDENAVKSELISDERILGASFISDSTSGFVSSIESMNTIVILLIVCAAFLALTTLYNLADINITERRRELATVKVLGFFDLETGEYIFRENVISSVIGILVGMVLGKLLHYFVCATVEVEAVMFNRQLVWWAYLLGAAFTAVFAAIVNFTLYFKLKKIDMVESLKSVE